MVERSTWTILSALQTSRYTSKHQCCKEGKTSLDGSLFELSSVSPLCFWGVRWAAFFSHHFYFMRPPVIFPWPHLRTAPVTTGRIRFISIWICSVVCWFSEISEQITLHVAQKSWCDCQKRAVRFRVPVACVSFTPGCCQEQQPWFVREVHGGGMDQQQRVHAAWPAGLPLPGHPHRHFRGGRSQRDCQEILHRWG